MIITPGRRSERVVDTVKKRSLLEKSDDIFGQGLREGVSSFGYTNAWLNNAFFKDEESADYLEVQKKRKLDLYNEINAYESDHEYGAVASTFAGISRGVVGGIANPYELAIGVASGGVGNAVSGVIGKVGGGSALKYAGSMLTETLADTIYNASVSEGMLTGDYGAYDFANDFVQGAVFAGVLNGGAKLLGKGFDTSKGYVDSKIADKKTKQNLGISDEAENAVRQANAEKIANVESVIETAENLTGKKVSDEALREVIKPDYDTSKLDAMNKSLEDPLVSDKLQRYKELTKDIRSGQKGLTKEVAAELEQHKLKIDDLEKKLSVANMTTEELNTIAKQEVVDMFGLGMTQKEATEIFGGPRSDLKTALNEVYLDLTSGVGRRVREIVNGKSIDDYINYYKNKYPILSDVNITVDKKLKDGGNFNPRTKTISLRSGGVDDLNLGVLRHEIEHAFDMLGDTKFIPKSQNTAVWKNDKNKIIGDIANFVKGHHKRGEESFELSYLTNKKKQELINSKIVETPELKYARNQYKEILEKNGIDDVDLSKKYKEFYELEESLNEHMQSKLGEGASLETYMNELDNLNKSALNVDDKKLSELVTRQNSEADLGYKESEVEIENKMKYNEEVINNDPELKAMSDSINKALSEGEFNSADDSTNSGIMAYIMCKIGG